MVVQIPSLMQLRLFPGCLILLKPVISFCKLFAIWLYRNLIIYFHFQEDTNFEMLQGKRGSESWLSWKLSPVRAYPWHYMNEHSGFEALHKQSHGYSLPLSRCSICGIRARTSAWSFIYEETGDFKQNLHLLERDFFEGGWLLLLHHSMKRK